MINNDYILEIIHHKRLNNFKIFILNGMKNDMKTKIKQLLSIGTVIFIQECEYSYLFEVQNVDKYFIQCILDRNRINFSYNEKTHLLYIYK